MANRLGDADIQENSPHLKSGALNRTAFYFNKTSLSSVLTMRSLTAYIATKELFVLPIGW